MRYAYGDNRRRDLNSFKKRVSITFGVGRGCLSFIFGVLSMLFFIYIFSFLNVFIQSVYIQPTIISRLFFCLQASVNHFLREINPFHYGITNRRLRGKGGGEVGGGGWGTEKISVTSVRREGESAAEGDFCAGHGSPRGS